MTYDLVSPSKEELLLIKKGNLELINKYYFANLNFIKVIARSFCIHNAKTKLFDYEDMTQEVYLYFSKLKLENKIKFIRSVKDVCYYVVYGGERVFHQVRQGETEILTILDEPVTRQRAHGGEPVYLYETIEDEFDVVDKLYPEKSYTDDVFEMIKQYLTAREVEAYKYFYYTDLTAREVGAKLGITINGAQSLKNSVIRKLKKVNESIAEKLNSLGYPLKLVS